MKENVAILGASDNPERYAHKAFKMLQEYGHKVFPVNPHLESIESIPVSKDLKSLETQHIDTLTLYINPQRLAPYLEDILALKPRRVIFNPGTESPDIEVALKNAGIEPLEACTLVLLRTNQF